MLCVSMGTDMTSCKSIQSVLVFASWLLCLDHILLHTFLGVSLLYDDEVVSFLSFFISFSLAAIVIAAFNLTLFYTNPQAFSQTSV